MPLPNLTGQNVQGWFENASASDLSTWASDANSSWANSWSSRFTLTTPQSNWLARWHSDDKGFFMSCLSRLASAKSGSYSIDFGDYNSDGFGYTGSAAKDKVVWHLDFTYAFGIPILTSFWKTVEHTS